MCGRHTSIFQKSFFKSFIKVFRCTAGIKDSKQDWLPAITSSGYTSTWMTENLHRHIFPPLSLGIRTQDMRPQSSTTSRSSRLLRPSLSTAAGFGCQLAKTAACTFHPKMSHWQDYGLKHNKAQVGGVAIYTNLAGISRVMQDSARCGCQSLTAWLPSKPDCGSCRSLPSLVSHALT